MLLIDVETSVPKFFFILPAFSTNQNFWVCNCYPSSKLRNHFVEYNAIVER